MPPVPSLARRSGPHRRVAGLLVALSLTAVATGGCRHRPPRPSADADAAPSVLEEAGVRGARALVLPADRASAKLARAVSRHLEVLPLRVRHPADAGRRALADGEERLDVADWQRRAWDRRVPWLLVARSVDEDDPGGADPPRRAPVAGSQRSTLTLLPARAGEPITSWDVRSGPDLGAAAVALRAGVREDLALPAPDGGSGVSGWMLADSGVLDRLRSTVVIAPDATALAEIREQLERYPLDNALIELEGAALLLQGRTEEAEVSFRRAQAHHPEGISQLPLLAERAGALGDVERQLVLWRAAAEIWPTRLDYAVALARLLAELERPGEAVDALLAAVATVEPHVPLTPLDTAAPADPAPIDAVVRWTRHALVADARYELGWALHEGQRLDDALVAYTEARDRYAEVDEPDHVASCANNLGVLLIEMGRPLAAIPNLRRAASLRMDDPPSAGQATTLYNLGAAYQAVGRMTDASDAFRRAAERYDTLGETEDGFDTWLDVLVVEGELGSAEQVEQVFDAVVERIGDDDDDGAARRARALMAVGVARARVDRPDEALAALDEALATFVALGDRLREGQARYNMAIPCLARGDHDAALAHLAEARAIADELDDRESVVDIEMQMQQIEQLR